MTSRYAGMSYCKAPAITFLLVAVGWGTCAHAELNEIIVTAEKEPENSQKVGVSITTFDAGQLLDLQAWNNGVIASQASNVQMYTAGSLESFTIRGVGSNEFNGNFGSPVAIHLNEVNIPKPWMNSMPLFDLDRVELLKGPQGTLFGRNTTGGSVNYYVAEPTAELTGNVDLSLDEYERYRLESYISGRLSGQFEGRVAVLVGGGDGGPQTNLLTHDDIGAWDHQQIRGQLRWHNGGTEARVIAHYGRDRSDLDATKSPGIFEPGGTYCPQLLAGSVERQRDACLKFGGLGPDLAGEIEPQPLDEVTQDYWARKNDTRAGGLLRIDHEFTRGTLTSLTGYENFERDNRDDPDGSIYASANSDWYSKIDQFSEEIRYAGSLNDSFDYLAGAVYYHESMTEIDSTDFSENPLGIVPPTSPRLAANYDQTIDSLAVFVNTTIRLAESLEAVAGLRWTHDETELEGSTFLAANDPQGIADVVTPVVPVDSLDDSRRDRDLSWRLGLNWELQENLMIYGSVSTAYRAGGYSVAIGGPMVEFEPENILAYEAGFKSRLLSNTLQLNAAMFRYEYDDVQANVDDPASTLLPITRNIGNSVITGFDADVWWLPNDRLDIKAGIGYLDAEYTDTDRTVTTYNGTIAIDGKSPVNTPEWNFYGFARYRLPLANGWSTALIADYSWTDERFLEITNQAFDQADAYWLVNARAELTSPSQQWHMSLWVKNLTDAEYLTYINNISFVKLHIYGQPQTFGASVRWTF